MTPTSPRPRARSRRWAIAALGALVVAGCARGSERSEAPPEDAPAAHDLAFDSAAELEAELEIVDREIDMLAEYMAARPGWSPPGPADADPRVELDAARATRDAARRALGAADTARAADSLRATAGRIERVKRLLGIAEEMGVEFDPESVPAGD